MAKKLTKPKPPKTGNEPLFTPKYIEKRPVLGMTLMKMTGSYSLKDFCKDYNKVPDRNLIRELEELQEHMNKCKNITEFMNQFHTRYGEIRDSKELRNALRPIKNKFNVDFEGNVTHIHTKPNGNGQFTIFGFTYDNVFEILLLDPKHEIAGTK